MRKGPGLRGTRPLVPSPDDITVLGLGRPVGGAAGRCADLDLLGADRGGLGQAQREHAVVKAGLSLVGVDLDRQRERAVEGAVADLAAVELPLALFSCLLVLGL